jgi:Fe-S oxidoreductase
MATYKAEFYAQYYKGSLRPRSAYAMGLIYWWARLATKIPRVANFFSTTPPFSTLVKSIGGIAPQREMPTFAPETFRDWYAKRQGRSDLGRERPHAKAQTRPNDQGKTPPVILWPDTFNNFLMPSAAIAGHRVLEAAGFEVSLPEKPLCCGRPLYDFGMLDTAKKLLRQILQELAPSIRGGAKLVGIEPSCIAVFRDELLNLFPHDEDAKRLSKNAYVLSEFLCKYAPDWQPPQLQRKALVHRHCHHHAILDFDAEEAMLKRLGLDYEILDSGCCGMAGSFGFEKENYDVSKACADRVLIPRIQDADEDALIIADGFSCREQIMAFTDRKPLHFSEVIELATRQGD